MPLTYFPRPWACCVLSKFLLISVLRMIARIFLNLVLILLGFIPQALVSLTKTIAEMIMGS